MKFLIKKRQILALVVIGIVLSSFIILAFNPLNNPHLELMFNIDKSVVDVNEKVQFNYKISGPSTDAFLTFGDGESISLENLPDSISHNYSIQGVFNPVLWARNIHGKYFSKSLKIQVLNDAPTFEIKFDKRNRR